MIDIGKINIFPIISEHYSTLIHYANKKPLMGDYVVFVGFPILLGILSFLCSIKIDATSAAVITTAVTILAGLLFNLLVLIYNLACNIREETNKKALISLFIEINANIAYSILISLVSLVPLIYLSVFNGGKIIVELVSSIIVSVVAHLLLTLLMILKRTHTLFNREFNRQLKQC